MSIPLYRKKTIAAIMAALDLDRYDDAHQDTAHGTPELPMLSIRTVELYLDMLGTQPPRKALVLEIGCGSGDAFEVFPQITHAVEPARKRFEVAVNLPAKHHHVEVVQAVAECLPYEPATFDAVLMFNGFFQVRSDYEVLVEVNRARRLGGLFLFNLLHNDNVDVVQGRILGPLNYVRVAGQFGFRLLMRHHHDAGDRWPAESRQTTCMLVFEKIRNFDPRGLALPYAPELVNAWPERDYHLQ